MEIDKSKVNDAEYMREVIKTNNPRSVRNLGQDLRNNPDFILEILGMEDFKYNWALIRVLGDDLKSNIGFLVSCAEKLMNKGVLKKGNFYEFARSLPKDFVKDNEEFWQAMNELGATDKENIHTVASIDYESIDYYERKKQKRQKSILENIGNITVDEFLKITNATDRANPKFMIRVITSNENLYSCMSSKLKNDKKFMESAIERNPRIGEIAQEEARKKEVEAEIAREAKMKEQEEKKQKEQREREGKIKQEYEQQGENHPRLILVNKFLDSNTSKKIFCQTNNIDEQELDKALKEVSGIFPEYKQKIEDRNRQTTAIHFNTLERIAGKLLSGEMTLIQYSRENNSNKKIDELLRVVKNAEDRKNLQKIIINAIASGNLRMMDYVRLFSPQYDYKTVINSINSFIKLAGKETPELQGKGKPINLAQIQVRQLKRFEKQYKKSDFVGLTIGFKDNNGEMKMVTITSENIDYAKKYLKLEDEYICYNTVNRAIFQLIKGEITKEEIDQRIEKRNAFLELKKKAKEKQQLTLEEAQTGKQMEAARALKEEYEEKGKNNGEVSSTDDETPGSAGDYR